MTATKSAKKSRKTSKAAKSDGVTMLVTLKGEAAPRIVIRLLSDKHIDKRATAIGCDLTAADTRSRVLRQIGKRSARFERKNGSAPDAAEQRKQLDAILAGFAAKQGASVSDKHMTARAHHN